MKRRLIGIVASLVLGSLGTFALVSYVQSAKDKALAGEQLVDVLVVREPVAKGTLVSALAAMVATEQVPAKVRAEGSVASLTPLEGLVAGVDLVPGEQLVAARFVTAQVAAGGSAASPDKLRLSVSLEPERAVGGQVQAGDTVAVLVSFDPFGERGEDGNTTANMTNLILHKVLVTAVQMEQKPPEPDENDVTKSAAPTLAPTGNLLVTLALDAPSVERVVFAAEHGRLWLSAEPSTAPEGGTKIVTPGNLF